MDENGHQEQPARKRSADSDAENAEAEPKRMKPNSSPGPSQEAASTSEKPSTSSAPADQMQAFFAQMVAKMDQGQIGEFLSLMKNRKEELDEKQRTTPATREPTVEPDDREEPVEIEVVEAKKEEDEETLSNPDEILHVEKSPTQSPQKRDEDHTLQITAVPRSASPKQATHSQPKKPADPVIGISPNALMMQSRPSTSSSSATPSMTTPITNGHPQMMPYGSTVQMINGQYVQLPFQYSGPPTVVPGTLFPPGAQARTVTHPAPSPNKPGPSHQVPIQRFEKVPALQAVPPLVGRSQPPQMMQQFMAAQKTAQPSPSRPDLGAMSIDEQQHMIMNQIKAMYGGQPTPKQIQDHLGGPVLTIEQNGGVYQIANPFMIRTPLKQPGQPQVQQMTQMRHNQMQPASSTATATAIPLVHPMQLGQMGQQGQHMIPQLVLQQQPQQQQQQQTTMAGGPSAATVSMASLVSPQQLTPGMYQMMPQFSQQQMQLLFAQQQHQQQQQQQLQLQNRQHKTEMPGTPSTSASAVANGGQLPSAVDVVQMDVLKQFLVPSIGLPTKPHANCDCYLQSAVFQQHQH